MQNTPDIKHWYDYKTFMNSDACLQQGMLSIGLCVFFIKNLNVNEMIYYYLHFDLFWFKSRVDSVVSLKGILDTRVYSRIFKNELIRVDWSSNDCFLI